MDAQAIQNFRAEVIGRKTLPTIPTVLAKIVQLTDGEGRTSRELVEVIEHDQALTSKILRLANSAFFGQSRQVATIPRAVVLLGFGTVRNLALSVKVWETLGPGLARRRLEDLWAHAASVALAGKWLSARLRAGDPDETFTAGLLHDVGRLVMAMRLGDLYWRTVEATTPEQTVDQVEAATFGVDHAEVGAWMLEAWNLPPAIVDAVRTHHAVSGRTGASQALVTANRLIGWTDLATGTCGPEAVSTFETLADHGITPATWAEVIASVRDDGLLSVHG
jgi:putative nucleotidyltransferase with HDIG domain